VFYSVFKTRDSGFSTRNSILDTRCLGTLALFSVSYCTHAHSARDGECWLDNTFDGRHQRLSHVLHRSNRRVTPSIFTYIFKYLMLADSNARKHHNTVERRKGVRFNRPTLKTGDARRRPLRVIVVVTTFMVSYTVHHIICIVPRWLSSTVRAGIPPWKKGTN